ncbi:MAG: outer membrane protein assembly factor BamA [Bdellovibrio sp.]
MNSATTDWFRFMMIVPLVLFLTNVPVASALEDLGPRKNLFRVDDIRVEGLKKVEKEAVLERINTKKGMMLDNYILRKDIERIYSLKYFDYIESHHDVEGGRNILRFKVKEKPIVSQIVFEGNDELSEDDLKGQIKTKNFTILDINTIKLDLAALSKFYEDKGFFLAKIDYEIVKRDDENVEVVFHISEYDKVRVKKVTFLGNAAFSDEQLKDIMETREEGLFSFMSGSGNYKEFSFQTDIERIKYFYKTKGHLQVNVGTPEITVSEDKKWVFITIKVVEGPQFTVNRITFQGEMLFPSSDLLEKIGLKEEATYSEDQLRKDIQLLTEMYQDEGYAFANVLRTLEVVPGENKVDVEFSFEKGKKAKFGKISVKGNTKTRDKVIRRELKIKEGEQFSGTALRESKENVNRLGFFEPNSIIFNTISPLGKDDVLDVEIQVKERNTGQITLGAGYSTATGGFLNASIAQNNFRGLGQNLSFSLTLADTNKTYNLGFTEPYLFDTKWTAGGDIFSTSNEASDSFSYKKDGFDIRVGHPIAEYTRMFVVYKYEDTNMKAVNDPTIDTDVENGLASSVQTSVVYDIRDNKFEPTKGIYSSYAIEYAGLGGEKKWLKNEADFRWFKTVYGDLVFRSRLYGSKLEMVDDIQIPRSEKFFLGGARNLRGFPYDAVGPKRKVTDSSGRERTFNERSLFAAYTTFELEHPLAREAGLKWVVFFDAGDAGKYDHIKLHKDYGFGLRWFSPIGILRFEWGFPLSDEGKDYGSQFHFDIGQLF